MSKNLGDSVPKQISSAVGTTRSHPLDLILGII